jgi:hypothetical protein
VLVFVDSSTAQSRVEKLTGFVVDTNVSQTEQAREIYDWITTNIGYDVKSFRKLKYTNKSTDEILSTRKGLCYEYSTLFSEMCNAAGIEAYSIAGYNKSFMYYKGRLFLRSNHTWNVFYADSAWHIVDATWGSGFVSYKPNLISKSANIIFRTPYSNNKSYFVPEQDFKYFNISADSLIKTHYPIDSKWLLLKNPICYNYFESDSLPKICPYPELAQQIENSRSKSEEMVYKLDAINSLSINKHNYFDIANGYYMVSNSYDLERPISESNVWQFEKYLSDYNVIIQSINRHKAITDSVYRERFKSLKALLGNQKRMTGKIKSKAKSAQKSFKSNNKQILGKNSSYRKKQESYMINAGKTELKLLSKNEYRDSVEVNTEELLNVSLELNEIKKQDNQLLFTADSLLNSIDLHINDDARYDDSIYTGNQRFNLNIVSLNNLILTNDEIIIRAYVDSLRFVYTEISNLLEEKKGTKSKLQETSKLYYSNTAAYQKSLREQITLLGKMFKLSNYSDSIFIRHNKCVNDLIASYKQCIDFTQKVANHGLLQKEIRKENLMALKQQKKNISRENKYFLKWHTSLYSSETAVYNSEKEIIKTIKSDAQRNQKLVETKLKKYKEAGSKK